MSYYKNNNNNTGGYNNNLNSNYMFNPQLFDTISKRAVNINSLFYEIEPALVIDIILNLDHPNYKTPDDIGKCKVLYFYSGNLSDENLLN